MSAVAVQNQEIHFYGGHTYVFTSFVYNASGDTCSIPVGSIFAAALPADSSRTAPTVTVAQGASNDTATLTGGTVGFKVVLVSRHTGTASAR